MSSNSYATDGKCHNANRGTYGHECGKRASWIGVKQSGFTSGFCAHCREYGDEAQGMAEWHRRCDFEGGARLAPDPSRR